MKRIMVSREVADFLDLNDDGTGYWKDVLLEQHTLAYSKGFEEVKDEAMCMVNYTPMEVAELLIKGYETELTPEETLKKMYFNCRLSHDEDDATFARGILWALDTLGIQIKEVNAK